MRLIIIKSNAEVGETHRNKIYLLCDSLNK